MTDASMKHLPRTLTFAAIGLDNPFTQQCLPDVPPFLKGILAQFGGRTQSEAEEFLSKLEQQEVYT
jgi:fructose-bisphosphate aldolase class 1